MLDVPLDKHALKRSLVHLETTTAYSLDEGDLANAINEYLSWVSSEDRDFSDEMLSARKKFSQLILEQPDECHSKLWEDCLREIGRLPPEPKARADGKKLISEAITERFGDKCAKYDPDCDTCRAWNSFGALLGHAPP